MLELTFTRLAGSDESRRLLVVGPSLGTSIEALWGECARLLPPEWEVVGWDLPGHGRSAPAANPFTIDDLADAVRGFSTDLARDRPTAYAGVSVGGAVGFQLALDPGPFATTIAIASAPKIGQTTDWLERAELVRQAGTPVLVAGSVLRWFAPGFTDRAPRTVDTLLRSLSDTDRFSYAWVCEALAYFDLREQLVRSRIPIAVIAGGHDQVVTPELAMTATGTVHIMQRCAHLPPAEDPAATAELLTTLLTAKATL